MDDAVLDLALKTIAVAVWLPWVAQTLRRVFRALSDGRIEVYVGRQLRPDRKDSALHYWTWIPVLAACSALWLFLLLHLAAKWSALLRG